MATETLHLTISGIEVEVVRKAIKNLHLGVYPPLGRVRVAVPVLLSDEAVRLAVIDKLGWIKRQQAKFAEQPRQSPREMVSGESHWFMGRRYRLRVREQDGMPRVAVRGIATLDLFVRPNTDAARREAILARWHREQLKELIPPLVAKWEAALGVQVADWGIKRMKTRWGSCNLIARRVWFNLDLARKPAQCLEYIVAHELTHLLERRHDERFTVLLEAEMPQWRQVRDLLNSLPLAHEEWGY